MQNDQKIKIPTSISNNPLNYVKPLIVNLYYKTPQPPVGAYDPPHPDDVGKKVTNPYKMVFKSKLDRLPELNTIDKEIREVHKDMDFLDIETVEKNLDKVRTSMPSSLFQKPTIIEKSNDVASLIK